MMALANADVAAKGTSSSTVRRTIPRCGCFIRVWAEAADPTAAETVTDRSEVWLVVVAGHEPRRDAVPEERGERPEDEPDHRRDDDRVAAATRCDFLRGRATPRRTEGLIFPDRKAKASRSWKIKPQRFGEG